VKLLFLFPTQIATVLSAVDNEALVRLYGADFHRVQLHYVSYGEA